VVVIGGKYGSLNIGSNKSFTELEYDFAISIGKPVVGFVVDKNIKLTEDKIELDRDRRQSLENFKAKVTANRMCKFWLSSADLGAKVSRSITQIIRQQPGIGWIRRDEAVKLESEEVLRLKNRILELEKALEAERASKKEFASLSFNEQDSVTLNFDAHMQLTADEAKEGSSAGRMVKFENLAIQTSWGEVAQQISPALIVKTTPDSVANLISRSNLHAIAEELKARKEIDDEHKNSIQCVLSSQSLSKIRAMLIAAGFITVDIASETRSSAFSAFLKDAPTRLETRRVEYWIPTPEGIRYFGPKAVDSFAYVEMPEAVGLSRE
jgi:hypothetical protein